MVKILLIRHAMTDSVGKRLSGRMPFVSLNEEGLRQSRKLAQRLAAYSISAIYSSPLERAFETAAEIAVIQNLNPIPSDDFLEIDFGKWTNKTFEELSTDALFARFNFHRSRTFIPDGELMAEAQLRIVKGLEKIKLNHPDSIVGVISHSDLIKAALAFYAGVPLDLFQRFEISPASVSTLELYEDSVRIISTNETNHL